MNENLTWGEIVNNITTAYETLQKDKIIVYKGKEITNTKDFVDIVSANIITLLFNDMLDNLKTRQVKEDIKRLIDML